MRSPRPPRPLGKEGAAMWRRIWALNAPWIDRERDVEIVLLVCEQTDERTRLREMVLQDDSWRDRSALRSLESQMADRLGELGLNPLQRKLVQGAEPTVGKLATIRALRSDRDAG